MMVQLAQVQIIESNSFGLRTILVLRLLQLPPPFQDLHMPPSLRAPPWREEVGTACGATHELSEPCDAGCDTYVRAVGIPCAFELEVVGLAHAEGVDQDS
jgi:hypothetical protein